MHYCIYVEIELPIKKRKVKKKKQKVRKLTYILPADMLSPQHMYTVRYTGGGGY